MIFFLFCLFIVLYNVTLLLAKCQHVSRSSVRAAAPRSIPSTYPTNIFNIRKHVDRERGVLRLSVADSDSLATENTSTKNSGDTKTSLSDNQIQSVNPSSSDSSPPQTTEATTNGSIVSPSPNSQSTPKKSPLTARERLRAARVLSRYNTESKASASKSGMGNKVLDALRETDRGKKKRSGLPEAPTNLFDDSKRGMPKAGLTFDFPGGADLLVIAFSFVFISTVMFATTYFVWKVGAIHFNEY